ncbi:cytochrome c oxidase subunit 6C-1-like [Coregonus clupeaformis]|uniref:cytochrome c oxidase subunit 6C-1-like n=2 Tax=Coregonus clupeaformis TaxID=59861 RepID=UPI001E1C3841|nr:cytochrome c oxidase subunit 6C-1-like [Coregonus clupeaformis]
MIFRVSWVGPFNYSDCPSACPVVFYPKDQRVRAALTYFGEGRELFLYSTMSLAKPAMRGLLGKRLRFHLPIAFALSLVAAAAFKYGVTEPRKQAYADFYKQYVATKEFNNMREAGIFESVRPTGE